jgi:hypothetical protein
MSTAELTNFVLYSAGALGGVIVLYLSARSGLCARLHTRSSPTAAGSASHLQPSSSDSPPWSSSSHLRPTPAARRTVMRDGSIAPDRPIDVDFDWGDWEDEEDAAKPGPAVAADPTSTGSTHRALHTLRSLPHTAAVVRQGQTSDVPSPELQHSAFASSTPSFSSSFLAPSNSLTPYLSPTSSSSNSSASILRAQQAAAGSAPRLPPLPPPTSSSSATLLAGDDGWGWGDEKLDEEDEEAPRHPKTQPPPSSALPQTPQQPPAPVLAAPDPPDAPSFEGWGEVDW